ncbi:hypothetical protein ACTFIY_006646 [Dictyostelium cf. discoideum]
MEDISLDQYIRNNKSTQSGGRARRFNNTDSPKTSQRRINIRNNFKNESSPVKFTARLDTTSINGGGGSGGGSTKPLRRIPVRSHNTTTTTTTSSSSSAPPPPLKITIQNNTTTKKEVRERHDIPSRFDGNNLPRIRITKTVDRNSSLSRPIIRSSRNNVDSRISSGGRSISSRYSVDSSTTSSSSSSSSSSSGRNNIRRNSYDSDHSSGSGPTLFERRNGGYNGPTGKSLQLFTGSRLNISNLHHAISEADLKVLFDSLGEIKQIKIHYDHSGRSDGTGYVIYSRHNDAMAALKKYNGAQLDGRTLKITTGPSLQEDIGRSSLGIYYSLRVSKSFLVRLFAFHVQHACSPCKRNDFRQGEEEMKQSLREYQEEPTLETIPVGNTTIETIPVSNTTIETIKGLFKLNKKEPLGFICLSISHLCCNGNCVVLSHLTVETKEINDECTHCHFCGNNCIHLKNHLIASNLGLQKVWLSSTVLHHSKNKDLLIILK